MSRKGTISESSESSSKEKIILDKVTTTYNRLTKVAARTAVFSFVTGFLGYGLYVGSQESNIEDSKNKLMQTQENISDRVQEYLISKYVGDDSVFDAHDIARIGNDLGIEDVVYMHDSRVNVLTEDDSRNSYFLGNTLYISLDDARRLAYNTDYKSEL